MILSFLIFILHSIPSSCFCKSVYHVMFLLSTTPVRPRLYLTSSDPETWNVFQSLTTICPLSCRIRNDFKLKFIQSHIQKTKTNNSPAVIYILLNNFVWNIFLVSFSKTCCYENRRTLIFVILTFPFVKSQSVYRVFLSIMQNPL